MPELPMVERTRRLLHDACVGGVIEACQQVEDTKVFPSPNAASMAKLEGMRVVDSGRHGKWLWLRCSVSQNDCNRGQCWWLYIHLGMTGTMFLRDESDGGPVKYPSSRVLLAPPHEQWPPKFYKFTLTVRQRDESKVPVELAFIDPRRFGKVLLLDPDSAKDPLQHPTHDLAPDPLLNLPALQHFETILAPSHRPIKTLLLDQRALVAGIGNWVADDVLYMARIHPETPGSALTQKERSSLRDAIHKVIELAAGVNADSSQFPSHWLFHHRWESGKGSRTLQDGTVLKFIRVGGRSTVLVDRVQKKKTRAKKPSQDA